MLILSIKVKVAKKKSKKKKNNDESLQVSRKCQLIAHVQK